MHTFNGYTYHNALREVSVMIPAKHSGNATRASKEILLLQNNFSKTNAQNEIFSTCMTRFSFSTKVQYIHSYPQVSFY